MRKRNRDGETRIFKICCGITCAAFHLQTDQGGDDNPLAREMHYDHSQNLHEHINTAYPAHVCLIGTTLPNGYAQITPAGTPWCLTTNLRIWERGQGID